MLNSQLGIAPINWCNDDDPNLGKETPFNQIIEEMSLAGYRGTELGNKYPRDPQQLQQALAAHHLQLTSAWFSTYFTQEELYEQTLERFMAHLSFMRAMGASFINICECGHAIQGTESAILGPKKPLFTDQQWQRLVTGLHSIGRIAHDYNIQLVYHYHAGTGVFTAKELAVLMQHTSPQLLSLLLDTGHAAFAGIDPLELIQQYGQRIRYVHLKDVREAVLSEVKEKNWSFMDAVRAGVFTVPGDGMINFAPILQALNKLNYQGWMIVEAEQDPQKAPPLVYARKAYDYLQELI